MSIEQDTLFDSPDDILQPDLRIPFKMLLSWNDVIGYASKWQVTRGHLDTWLKRSRERGAEVLQAAGATGRIIEIRKQGKPKEMADGGFQPGKITVTKYWQADRVFFQEPVGLIIRLWRPTALTFDISNLLIKPVLDGFVDVRVLRDDDVSCLPQVAFDFRGVDRTLGFTTDERTARRDFQQARIQKGKKPKPLPMRSRIWFDFYRLKRFPGGSIYASGILSN